MLIAACAAHAPAPVRVPSTTELVDGQVRVVFNTTAGMSYRIQHTNDPAAWTYFPESIYGFGQTVRYAVYDLPADTTAAASLPPAGPVPSEYLFFMITAFNDGTAVASCLGLDDSPQKAYLPAFDLRYLGQTFCTQTHKAMGHEVPHQRWCHLFINGIYWGPEIIIERVDDAFMDAHFTPDTYTVVKQGGEAVSGNYADWTALGTLAATFPAASAAAKPGIYSQIEALVDLPNYIDYLIVNSYGQNGDWPDNNFRAGKGSLTGTKWKFIMWDAEWTLRQGGQSCPR